MHLYLTDEEVLLLKEALVWFQVKTFLQEKRGTAPEGKTRKVTYLRNVIHNQEVTDEENTTHNNPA